MEKISEQMHNTGYGTAVVGTGGPDTNYGLAQCYGLYSFYDKYTGPGDKAVCGNTTRRSTNFQAAAKKVVWSAVQAAPNNEGYAREEVSVAGTANDSAYVLLIVGGVWTQEGRALNTGCFMRYSDRDFLNKEQEKGSSEDNVLVIVVAVVSSVIVLVVGIAIVAYIRKHRYIQMKRRVSQELHHNSLNFKYSLEKATNSFDEVNRLGQGGFGTGVLADGREIAIKTLYFNNRHKAADFYNKVNIISSVEHKNLVRLLGCSCSGPESLLIYEYLPNRSLDRFIFGNNSTHEIDCLISDSKIPPFHGPFKKIRATLVQLLLELCMGYMAPEYLAHGQLTEKADVYSFGVLLLEIITGRLNSKASEYSDSLTWKHFQSGTAEQVIDPCLVLDDNHRSNVLNEILRVLHIGLLCTQEIPSLRPSMSKALKMPTKKEEHLELEAPSNPPFIHESTMELHD
ncbi:hypothetical protein JHK85_023331 [Glycine max]|nr:hypothetical protein JHK85_023331 [Glycine max]KAG5026952.1 hypothetical protein JHK86_022866 [Glycine max]